jgi:type IV pilus assembly protein PilV
MHRPRSLQEGVMLIEALIGILLFSIGILALLGMQGFSMRATIDAKYRSEASFLANEIVGTMWGDADNLENYSDANCASTPKCVAWKTRVAALLPGTADAGVEPTIAIATRQATITVRWKRPGDTDPSRHVVVAQIYRTTDP